VASGRSTQKQCGGWRRLRDTCTHSGSICKKTKVFQGCLKVCSTTFFCYWRTWRLCCKGSDAVHTVCAEWGRKKINTYSLQARIHFFSHDRGQSARTFPVNRVWVIYACSISLPLSLSISRSLYIYTHKIYRCAQICVCVYRAHSAPINPNSNKMTMLNLCSVRATTSA
jgi:hypothetical protein